MWSFGAFATACARLANRARGVALYQRDAARLEPDRGEARGHLGDAVGWAEPPPTRGETKMPGSVLVCEGRQRNRDHQGSEDEDRAEGNPSQADPAIRSRRQRSPARA